LWKEKLRISPSAADMLFLEALEKAGLTRFGGFKFDCELWLPVCKPDARWDDFQLATFLDGDPVHSKDRQRDKDEFIDSVLNWCNWTPLRFPYRPPLSNRQLTQILAQVKGVLREKGGL